jgi:hypothetical protein
MEFKEEGEMWSNICLRNIESLFPGKQEDFI